MERTIVKVNVRQPRGPGDVFSLEAVIDDTIEDSIILGHCFERLQKPLGLERKPLDSFRLSDSDCVQHTGNSGVSLLIGPPDEPWTDTAWFYISEHQSVRPTGEYRMILGKAWKGRIRGPRGDGKKNLRAAPSVLRGEDSKERREEAERNEARRRREAKEIDEQLERARRERQNGQCSHNGQNGQSTS
ncbi:uncharacterized protein BJX67DRAFT_322686 [Aspergillus lucknowensis]|uniref:Uncharacterized protein n=1 Tax=Aspergillus lucknowensis TaxID=176173 RepID=A0ABR4M2L1_9EURO